MMEFTAEMIAGFLGGDIVGDKTVKVHTVSSIEEGKVGSMAYLVNPKYEPFLYTTEASIVLVDRSFTPQREVKPTLVKVDDAGAAVLRLLEMYNAARPQKKGVSERASISPEASLGEGCYVGDFAVIEAGARIGDGCRMLPAGLRRRRRGDRPGDDALPRREDLRRVSASAAGASSTRAP